jgi:hypothetical protein
MAAPAETAPDLRPLVGEVAALRAAVEALRDEMGTLRISMWIACTLSGAVSGMGATLGACLAGLR